VVLRHVVRLAAAAFTVAAAGVVVPSPAEASTCSTTSGVSVVVDFHQLEGGVQTFCDASGAGDDAATQFEDAGHTLTYVNGEPFVCQVDSKPDTQCARTPPANAYWSLWWSDGESGTWKYSSAGVTSLEVPDGGSVALSWQGQSSQAKPRVSPPAHTSGSPSSSPSTHPGSPSHPSTAPGQAPSSAPGSTSPSGSSSTAPQKAGRHGTSTRRADPLKAGKAQGKSSHGPDDTQAGEPSGLVASDSGDDSGGADSGGLPGWVAPLAIAVLFVGAGAIALARRKGSGSP
jgi:hypothetical protein